MALSAWAVPHISRLLPLDDESIKQIIAYSETLSKEAASEHFQNLLGSSPHALEFIASFNSRRQAPVNELPVASSSGIAESEVPIPSARPRKNKKPFNKLPPPRQPENYGDVGGAYIKGAGSDYMVSRPKAQKDAHLADSLALKSDPDDVKTPIPSTTSTAATTARKLPPSAAGNMISDGQSSRSSSPNAKSKAKIHVSGGLSMHGQSATINDLDSAIRSLEIQTNPNLSSGQDDTRRRCNCMATRHALLTAAPNCLSCGKIICAKEGLGPCTFCHHPLLSSSELQAMVKILREERGKEKMEVNNASHKRAEVSKFPRPFSNMSSTPVSSSAPSSDSESEKLAAAKQHRDKLLNYQAENARRTRIHDEAADFETPDAGQNLWATPQERALQLKRQQKVLREQEWNSRPEYEKRRQVVSIDIVGGKAIRRMARVEMPQEGEESGNEEVGLEESAKVEGGAFSNNPLLGGLIRPVYHNLDKDKAPHEERHSTWRKVQDDNDDNEQWILDGGVYGGHNEASELGDRIEARACG